MKSLFEETRIKSLTMPNRFVRSATWMAMADPDGACTDRLYDCYETLGKGGIFTLDDLADLATDELIQKKRVEPRRRADSKRSDDKGGILGDYGLTDEQGNEIIMAARAHWFEDEESSPAAEEAATPESTEEDAAADGDQ